MAEWEEKLNTLLSDPDAMAQVMQMAQSLSQQLGTQGGGAQPEQNGAAPPPNGTASAPPPPPDGAGASGAALPDLSALLGSIDPATIRKLMPVLAQMNRPESGETAALLHALRPFLKQERQEKVDRAAQLARLIHLAKTFLLSGEG